MNINNKLRYLFFILLICILSSGCSGKTSNDNENLEEIQFVCTKTIENAPDNILFGVSGRSGENEYIEVVTDLPDDIQIIHKVDKPLSSEKLYKILQRYILSTDIKNIFTDTKECKITDYKYEYIMKSTGNASYYIPVIAFTIDDYSEIYIDVEFGCFIY